MAKEIRRFDRHEHMDAQTREGILELINKLMLLNTETFTVRNYLYGFFDGYDYSEVLPEHNEMKELKEESFELYLKVLGVCMIVSKYPDGTTQI